MTRMRGRFGRESGAQLKEKVAESITVDLKNKGGDGGCGGTS